MHQPSGGAGSKEDQIRDRGIIVPSQIQPDEHANLARWPHSKVLSLRPPACSATFARIGTRKAYSS